MLFKSLHKAEGNTFGQDPDSVKDADIYAIWDMGQDRVQREGLILHREDDPVWTNIQGRYHAILKIWEVFLADRDSDAKEFIVGGSRQIFQSAESFPETAGRTAQMIVKVRIGSP